MVLAHSFNVKKVTDVKHISVKWMLQMSIPDQKEHLSCPISINGRALMAESITSMNKRQPSQQHPSQFRSAHIPEILYIYIHAKCNINHRNMPRTDKRPQRAYTNNYSVLGNLHDDALKVLYLNVTMSSWVGHASHVECFGCYSPWYDKRYDKRYE